MVTGRRFRVWVPFGYAVTAVSCAQIVGLTGEYREGSNGSGGETSGAAGADQGGTSTGGQAGQTGATGGVMVATGGVMVATGGHAGDAGDGGSGDVGSGGDTNGGTGTSGAAGDGGSAGSGGDGGSGGSVVVPRSCRGGLMACGPDEGDYDCCTSLLVPEGDFNRSNDDDHPAHVHAFRLDAYEVTVARFRKFVAAFDAGYTPPEGSGRNPSNDMDPGWKLAFTELLPADGTALRSELKCLEDSYTWTDEPGQNENRPINCVDWYVAGAFCIWDGGRLPTEAEWNYAAAGGGEQRIYPWSVPSESTDIDERYASYYADPLADYCSGDYKDGCTIADFIRPGSRSPLGDGRWGHSDLSGNVYEWVQDSYGDFPDPCVNCANLTDSTDRVARGGCYINYYLLVLTTSRLRWDAALADSGVGMRCARDLP